MSTPDAPAPAEATFPLSRDAVIEVVTRAHLGSASADSARAAETLAAHSKLPKRVAENLGAGFGQWDFFPEIADIVDFALAYVAPATEEDVWALARAWAADDAEGRHTLLALVGRDILQRELERIDVPRLRELVDEGRPARARELREGLGLRVAAKGARKSGRGAAPAKAKAKATAPKAERTIPTRMPKPELRPPKKLEPPLDAKRFTHPKFGEAELVSQEGEGPDAKLTLRFAAGQKILLARYVTEVPSTSRPPMGGAE